MLVGVVVCVLFRACLVIRSRLFACGVSFVRRNSFCFGCSFYFLYVDEVLYVRLNPLFQMLK